MDCYYGFISFQREIHLSVKTVTYHEHQDPFDFNGKT